MNILQMEDMVKGLPDQLLMQEAQMPSGRIPQFLALSEVQRRKEMRDRFQQPPQATVADQILQSGIASAMPQQPPQGGMAPPQGPPPGGPPGPQGPVMAYGGGQMPYRMYGGGMVPYRMQEGRTIPNFGVNLPSFGGSRNSNLLSIEEILKIPEELRSPEQNQIIASLLPQMQEVAMNIPAPQVPEMISAAPPPGGISQDISVGGGGLSTDTRVTGGGMRPLSATPPAGTPPAAPGMGADSFMQYVPQVQQMVSAMMPAPAGFDVAGYTKAFKPQESDYLNPEFQKQRQAMVENLRAEAQKRREADIALAQRYMSEAETPIKKAEEEAKKAAIGAVLTRLGAGLMRGDAAAGLAAATESAESIIGRQRELSAAERRAAKQEFRAAEREAIRGERGSADQAFNMEAQNLSADENAQRQYVRDSKQFSQQVFGLLREAGKDQRAAHMDSIRLTFNISQAIDTALREQKREAGLTDRQYMQTFGSVFDKIISSVQDATIMDPTTGEERSPTADELIELANKKTTEVLQGQGIFPSPVVRIKTQEEYNKLPSGTVFIDPQGMKRTKP